MSPSEFCCDALCLLLLNLYTRFGVDYIYAPSCLKLLTLHVRRYSECLDVGLDESTCSHDVELSGWFSRMVETKKEIHTDIRCFI